MNQPGLELLWSSKNSYDSEVKYTKGTHLQAKANRGICAGLSMEWCKNILKGVRPELSEPFLLQAFLYQRFYDWGKNDDSKNAKIFAVAEVNAGQFHFSGTARLTAEEMWEKEGVWWGGYNVHSIGIAKIEPSKWLLYDPNYGCFVCHSQSAMAQQIRKGGIALGAATFMQFFPITLA